MIRLENTPCFLPEGSSFQGTLVLRTQTHIQGMVEGRIESFTTSAIHIEEKSEVFGEIYAKGLVVVSGRVVGQIFSEFLIEVYPDAQIEGELHAPRIKIMPGAKVDGDIFIDSKKLAA